MWFKENKILNGFLSCLLLTVITALVILLLQRFLRIELLLNAKMYIFAILPEIFLLRYFARKEKHKAVMGAVLSLLITLGGVIAILMKYNYLSL